MGRLLGEAKGGLMDLNDKIRRLEGKPKVPRERLRGAYVLIGGLLLAFCSGLAHLVHNADIAGWIALTGICLFGVGLLLSFLDID